VIQELELSKKEFISKINNIFESKKIFSEYGKINFMKKNYPFAMYMTNLNNVSMFNNGTFHFNITLPTKLDSDRNIEDKKKFIKIHNEAIKIIQWFEPILIAIYGSPDPFALYNDFSHANLFSPVSQRCAVSRYIGIGTYDTDKMIPGKILTIPIETHPEFNNYEWWFNKYYTNCAYNKLKEIGLDINFNKHYSHGIEIRFFDYINQTDKLFESFEFIIYLMDVILDLNENKNITNPIKNNLWNDLTYGIMTLGNQYYIQDEIINLFNEMLNIKIEPNILVNEIYYQIYWKLKIKFNDIEFENTNTNLENLSNLKTIFVPKGKFSKLCLSKQEINVNCKYIDEIINQIKKKNSNVENNIENIEINIENIETNIENNFCNSCCLIS
jgi:hypothetical protein